MESREAYANLLLPKLLADRDITGRDAALATELAYGTLRGQGTYDAVLAACSDRPLDKLDPPVRLVLRLGAHQLLGTRIGAHAAVATSVDLIKSVAGHGPAGYVNAVLRRVATRDADAWLEIVAPDSTTDHDAQLAIRYSHPRLDRRRLPGRPRRRRLPRRLPTELEAALAAGNARPRVTMATFPGGPPRDQVMPPSAEPGRWSPYAFTLDSGNPADSDRLRPGRRPRRSQPAGGHRPHPRPAGHRSRQRSRPRTLARHVRRPRRQDPPAGRPGQDRHPGTPT